MSIKGFKLTNDTVEKYDYESLDNRRPFDAFPLVSGHYWAAVNNVITDLTFAQLNRTERISVEPGDVIHLKTKGYSQGKAYFITDESGTILLTGQTIFNGELIVPSTGKYLYINVHNNSLSDFYLWIANKKTIRQTHEDLIYDVFSEEPIEHEFTNSGKYVNYQTGVLYTHSDLCCTDMIEIKNLVYKTNARNSYSVDGLAFFDSEQTYISGYQIKEAGTDMRKIEIPANAKYMIISANDSNSVVLGYPIRAQVIYDNEKIEEHDNLLSLMQNEVHTRTITDFVSNGYIDYEDGVFHSYMQGQYKVTDFIDIVLNTTAITNVVNKLSKDGIAFYDIDKNYISGYQKKTPGNAKLLIPADAKYVRLSNHTESAESPFATFYGLNNNIDCYEISCYGDSITEGMSTDGAHTATYGKSPYPARLTTILTDEGYNVTVYNHGHGGERCPAILTRAGAIGCYTNDDISLAANTQYRVGVQGNTVFSCGVDDKNGNPYPVYFTQVVEDTNPLHISGYDVSLTVTADVDYISSPTAIDIPKNSPLITGGLKRNEIMVVYGGVNDGNQINLNRWIELMKTLYGVTNKFIVLGCTHASRSFGIWNDVVGSSEEEKHQYYYNATIKAFGAHFIDLYDVFCYRAMDIALAAGYFTDKSSSEIATMRSKLSNHIIPAEFCYDKQSENNVHLSEEGYHVIATVISERLIQLDWIQK